MQKWFSLYSNILYMYFSEGFYQLPESAKNAASPSNPFKRILKVGGYTFVRLIGNIFQASEKPEDLMGKVWLYTVSQNNYDSLKFISSHLPEAVLVAGQNKEIGKYNQHVKRISLRRKILYYYKYLPLLYLFSKVKPKHTARFFDILFDAVGFYEVYSRKIRLYKPRYIVFANDHTPDARGMLLAAKANSIKTVYIQHASVSHIFPPLQYDLNLLEGQDAYEKYKACGPVSGKVELIGMPKADGFLSFRNKNSEIHVIGIGANLMDHTDEIRQVLSEITRTFPELIIRVRPHPRDSRDFDFVHGISTNISLSDGRKESTFEFLKQLDVLIAGNSGIHLEAVLLNVWSIYYNLNQAEHLHDYYGYVAKGLSDYAGSLQSLTAMLQQHRLHKPDVVHRANYYNATIGTQWEGKSGKLALTYIKNLEIRQ
jgi:hypothetical protein